jgi:uncharacterized membrane protein
MKKPAVFVALVLTAALSGAPVEAKVQVKFVNKTDRTVHMAVGIYITHFVAEGWFKIAPGESYLHTGDYIPAGALDSSMGYYAYAPKEGAKTVYWSGNWEEGLIHPTKKFLIGEYDDEFPDGLVTVGFRECPEGKINEEVETATVNFTIK